MVTSPIKVLYVDDEVNNLVAFQAGFRRDFDIHIAQSAEEGLQILQSNEMQVIISDQRMPVMTGIEFFATVIKRFPDPIRILLTGYSDIAAVIDAINTGQVYKYLTKPWDEETMRIFIQKSFEVYTLRKQNKLLTKKLVDTNRKLELLARHAVLS
ncbi:response regulator [Foetidibacter luteolus]|uniref:response regulator n=1 Tax=Foetidibacter luteolus TaxID=2608880 RepID=UPI00129B3A00|nr:response regulator [Foetidibacter luteolus]